MSTSNSEIDQSEYFNCESCNNETKCEDKINYIDENGPWLCPDCAHESDLLAPYSIDQCTALRMYAYKYNLTIEEAIEYQTHCHCCGREDKDGLFDEMCHQYCRSRCFDYIEEFRYPCYLEAACKVCPNWRYHANDREEKEEETLDIYDFEGTGEQLRRLRANNPKNDGETHDEYESRIWNMAYKEDAEEEEEKEKLLSKAEGENAALEQFRVALKGLQQEWHAKWQRDQAVKGKI
jgi:hypothetical protein